MNNFKMSKLNPIVLVLILILISILISFDKMPYLSLALVLIILSLQSIWSDKSLIELLSQLKFVLLISFVNTFFIWLTRTISNLEVDYLYLMALMGRFFVFASYTFALINNVTTKSLTMALIKYFKLSERVGYSFMAVYNSIPNYRKEFEQIKYIYTIRGLNKTGPFAGTINLMRYSIPLLVSSIRNGMRLSVAMENRGLGKYETRTYYQELVFTNKDRAFLISFLALVLILIVSGLKFSLIRFSFIAQ